MSLRGESAAGAAGKVASVRDVEDESVVGEEDVELRDREAWGTAVAGAAAVSSALARGGAVAEWVDDLDVGAGYAEAGGVSSGSSGSVGSLDAEGVSAALSYVSEYAVPLQRFLASRASAVHVHGRLPLVSPFRPGVPLVPVMRYGVAGSITVTSLDEGGGIYSRILAGERVVAQVVAPTGLGKTTKFPAAIATRCGVRVLQLEPNAKLAALARSRQQCVGLVSRAWSKVRKALLVVMSYQDFMGKMTGEDGLRLLSQFDVLYMDEAHSPIADIEATRAVVASRECPHLSVLSVSATIQGEEDAQASSGARSVVYTSKTLEELLDSDRFFSGQYSVDRTAIVVPTDQDVDAVRRRLVVERFQVRALDSASTLGDIAKVQEFLLDEDSMVKRFVVVSNEYGLGHNLSIAQIVVDGRCVVREFSADRLHMFLKHVKLDKAAVVQMCGRVGRKMVQRSVAIVCGAQDSFLDEPVLDDEYYLRLYVLLVACRLVPLPSLVARVAPFLPVGITEDIAVSILSSRLPVSVVIRYFAADGAVPVRWARALEVFADDGFRYNLSGHSEPVGEQLWVDQKVGGYYDDVKEYPLTVRVPFSAEGEDKVLMQAVSLAADGLIRLDKWAAPVSNEDLSDGEGDALPVRKGLPYRPRLVVGLPSASRLPMLEPVSYSYMPSGLVVSERGALEAPVPELYLKALRELDEDVTLKDFSVKCGLVQSVDSKGTERVSVENVEAVVVGTPVDVLSARGTPVVRFRKSVWEKLSAGEAVLGKDAISFFRAVQSNVSGFVDSDAFSGWTKVWDGVLLTLCAPENVDAMRRHNLVDRSTALLVMMLTRYSKGVNGIAKTSYLYGGLVRYIMGSRKDWDYIYKKESAKGKLPAAHSKEFFKRLLDLRVLFVQVVEVWQGEDIFVPRVVTMIQGLLPVCGRVGVKLYDDPGRSKLYVKPGGSSLLGWK